MNEPRHVLVLAPQCSELGLLEDLEEIAATLHGTITEPWSGGCAPGEPAWPTLLSGPGLGQVEIEEAVRSAARRAAQAGAVLVLAFLGHGMSSGTTLYFMTGSSRAEQPTTGVDIGSLLSQALDTVGLAGVIALVDTCHAAGAVPDLNSLSAGIRQGRTRLSLTMACGTHEEAYDLGLTRSLLAVLHSGIPGAGEYLLPAAVLNAARLDEALLRQSTVSVDFDGDHLTARTLWLARNPQYRDGISDVVLSGGTELVELGELFNLPNPLDSMKAGELDVLYDRLPELPSAERLWARRLLDGLRGTLATVALLRSWPGGTLTTEQLRRALAAVPPSSRGAANACLTASGDEFMREVVEFLLLRAPGTARCATGPLVEFVAALARNTGVPSDAPALAGWSVSLDVGIALADAFQKQGRKTEAMRLRLIVSLHAAVGDDWPESLDVWLLDGLEVLEHSLLDCEPHRAGVERKLAVALRGASTRARKMGVPLRRVEIAAPVPLLLEWRPEETPLGNLLGVHHDVVLRWSEHVQPQEARWWINEQARRCLEQMAESPDDAPVDWLGEHELDQVEELRERLAKGQYIRALALAYRPSKLRDMLETLLTYVPIVLWTAADGEVPAQVRDSLEKHWDQLPGEFCEAYRDRWRGTTPAVGDSGHLAVLRAVWNDPEWLDFCHLYEQYTTEREDPA